MPPLLWDHQPCDEAVAASLADAAGIDLVTARLLWQRGLTTPDAAARFLRPSLDHLHDPFALPDMAAAVDRVLAAIARRERIAIHGDYDVDGITSTVILERALELLGGDVVALHPGADPGRLRPAGAGRRAPARRRRPADRLGGLRHPQRRRRAAGARARRRPDRHRPSRARGRAADGAGRHQPEARATARTRTRTWPASASR